MVEKEEKKEGKKIEDNQIKKKNELTVKNPKKAPKNKFDKKKTQDVVNKELEEISKSSFARLAEPCEVDRDSHLRADKKPFLKKQK